MSEVNYRKPKYEGKFVFEFIKESEGEGYRKITFNPPLVVKYDIWEKKNPETGKDNFVEDLPILAYAEFDFGMVMETAVDKDHNFLMLGYEGLTTESSPEEVLAKTLSYDLFHAFCHPPEDPNYTHYNWALYGWLKDRGTVEEKD